MDNQQYNGVLGKNLPLIPLSQTGSDGNTLTPQPQQQDIESDPATPQLQSLISTETLVRRSARSSPQPTNPHSPQSGPPSHSNFAVTRKELPQTHIAAVSPYSSNQPMVPVPTPITTLTQTFKEERELPQSLWGCCNICLTSTSCRTRRPRHYKPPGWIYDHSGQYRHRDYVNRVVKKTPTDRYLHHIDGKLRKLIVACSDDVFRGNGASTWRRTYIRKMAPWKVRLATWVVDGTRNPDGFCGFTVQLCRAIPASIAMAFIPFSSSRPSHRWMFHGMYAPVAYKFHGDAKVWSNHVENRKGIAPIPWKDAVPTYNSLKPRHLCFLNSPFEDELHGVQCLSVDEWQASDGRDCNLSYLFVGYSTQHFSHDSVQDMLALHRIAETAARAAKLPAYWVSCSCMRDPAEIESDVYRIADVVRGAQSMIIALGQPANTLGLGGPKPSTDDLLIDWGRRMWTFPEVLLSQGSLIQVYVRDQDLDKPLTLSKNQVTSKIWLDSSESKKLVDHYMGNLTLSRLELASICLKCLFRRDTLQYLNGDQTYALMGLLSSRPRIDKSDSPFQAFARLSLANDSDALLERFVCLLPPSPNLPWHNMDDAYQSSLWDIKPSIQIAGICENDTVVIDGAYGASIRWKSFFPVGHTKRFAFSRLMAIRCMHLNVYTTIIAFVLLFLGAFLKALLPLAIALFLFALMIFFCTPMLIRISLGGKFCDVQAALFGVEGYINVATAERCIFGGAFGRMTWSTNGSPLSRYYVNKDGERVGIDPTTDPEIKARMEEAKRAKPGDMRIFTLIDTYSMEVTLFEAIQPPVFLILCGSEGGMQRAVGCSYHWATQTMHRETVLRMPTSVLNRMSRVPRLKIGIDKPGSGYKPR